MHGIPNGTGNKLLGRDDKPGKDVSEGFTEESRKQLKKKKASALKKVKT